MPQPSNGIIAGYVRRSSEMQKDNFSMDAQKRAVADSLPQEKRLLLAFYEDDERSARGEQIAKRPAFKRLLDDVQAGRVQMVVVHSLDRWSRNVMVTLQSFRILADHQVSFISLSEHIDYSTPEGRLQLTILAAFAAYFSDMLAKHTSKGKGERAAQGLLNGDVPFGYRHTGTKLPAEKDPTSNPGLRLMGELRIQGTEAENIADALNAAGYRTGSKRFGQRLFTKDTVTAILRNEFYAGYAPGDDHGTLLYKEQRYRGQHLATFTYEEWVRIRQETQAMHRAPQRPSSSKRTYEFAAYIADVQCGLLLRSRPGGSPEKRLSYYKDPAKTRRLPCPAGGRLQVRTELVREQFGDLLKSLKLPENWREIIRQKRAEEMDAAGIDREALEREKERLKLKRSRILKQHREGYLTDPEFYGEIAAVDLTLRQLENPDIKGINFDEVLSAGERLPGMAALWTVATVEERRDMVKLILEPGGLYYDLEQKTIAAIKPKPGFLPVLRMLDDIMEYDQAKGMLVKKKWQESNAHPSVPF